jgi:hypothetical protein
VAGTPGVIFINGALGASSINQPFMFVRKAIDIFLMALGIYTYPRCKSV